MAAMQIRQEPMRLLRKVRIAAGARSQNSGALTLRQNSVLSLRQNSVPPGLKIDVRQGIA
jgi:hypothetical protein